MREERDRADPERESGGVAPTAHDTPHESAGGAEVQQEADDPGLGEELKRRVVRLVHDDGRAAQQLVRQLEGARARAAGRMAGERVPGFLPPRPAGRARAPEARLRLADLRRVRELVPDSAGERDAHGEARDRERQRREAGDALDACAPLRCDRVAERRTRGGVDEDRAGDHDEREDPAVVCAHRARLAVVGDPVQRERDAEDGSADPAADPDRGEALDAVPIEEDPRSRREAGERDAEARVREQQRDDEGVEQDDADGSPTGSGEPECNRNAGVAEERELVTVAERRAEARDPSVVAVERGDALREQCPADEEREQERRRLGEPLARDDRADDQPEHREARVHERPVRVAPRAVRRGRPECRETGPDRESQQAAGERRGRGVEPGSGQGSEQDGGRGRRSEQQGKPPDPDERRVSRTAAEEKGTKARDCGCRCGPESHEPFARSAHGP